MKLEQNGIWRFFCLRCTAHGKWAPKHLKVNHAKTSQKREKKIRNQDSKADKSDAETISKEAESMLLKGGFRIKFWQYSGEKLHGEEGEMTTAVLGVGWRPEEDIICFKASLNFSQKRQGIHIKPDLSIIDIPQSIPLQLTKRMVLAQVMKIFDPQGILCPFTLYGKVYLLTLFKA